MLGKAIDVDPEYAEALGTLTDSVNTRTIQGWHESWSRGVDEASRLAGRALAAGPDNSTCLASAAFTYGVLSYRFEEAFELANRALMVHPNSVFVRNRAAAVYVVCGESDKAIAQCEAACRMNPLDSKKAATATFSILSSALYLARRYEESIRAGRRALVFAPQSNIARKYVAISLAQLGRTDEARAEIAELLKHQPNASLALFQLQGFQPQVDARAAPGGPAQGGLAGRIASPIFGATLCCGTAKTADAPRCHFAWVGSKVTMLRADFDWKALKADAGSRGQALSRLGIPACLLQMAELGEPGVDANGH